LSKSGVLKAVEAAGSQAGLAKALGVSEAYVSEWVKRGWIASGYVVKVEELFAVPRRLTVNPKFLVLVEGI
jgi:hypothetical protein